MSNGDYEDVSGTYDPGETAASEDVDPLDAFFAEMIQNQRDEEERNRLLAQMRAEEAQMTQPTTPAPTQGPTPWDPSKERSMGELMGTQFAPPQTGTTPPPMGINGGGQQYPLTPPVPPPNTTPLSSPTARMYMGPNISDSEVRALVPPGMSMNLMPPPTPDQSEGAAGRVAAMTAPKFRYGEPTLTSIDPASRQFAARQAIQQMVANGRPMSEAMQQFPEFLSQTGQRPINDYQRERIRLDEADMKRKAADSEARINKPLPLPKVETPTQLATRNRRLDQIEKELEAERTAVGMTDTAGVPNEKMRRLVAERLALMDQEAASQRRPTTIAPPTTGTTPGKKVLTKAKAAEFKQRADGNRAKAEAMARAEGYEF
jgi:hypothetical protein